MKHKKLKSRDLKAKRTEKVTLRQYVDQFPYPLSDYFVEKTMRSNLVWRGWDWKYTYKYLNEVFLVDNHNKD